MDELMNDYLWIVILAFIVAFILAFAVGANDVANSFATSVGAKVLTLKQACILASIFEVSGAVLLGHKVSDTIRKGILDVDIYEGNEVQLMYGMIAALIGCAAWLLIATWFKIPVSTTHSIVGATIGFGLVAHGTKGLNVGQIIIIAASWLVSPVLSGLISVAFFMLVYKFILKASRPVRAGFIALPFIYAFTVFVNILSITWDGPDLLKMDDLPLWLVFVISIVAGIITGIIAQAFVPYLRRKVINSQDVINNPSNLEKGIDNKAYANDNGENLNVTTVSTVSISAPAINDKDKIQESEENVNKLFSFLQVLSAIFSSFTHGGNDVSNAIGPLITIWLIYREGIVTSKTESPIWILAYGGIGIVVGLWFFGRRVIETIGKDLTRKITPATGFVIECGAATTVLIASKVGLPISTTHCQVGSVVFVGWAYGTTSQLTESADKKKKSVDWSLFRNIVLAWVVTLPAAAEVLWIVIVGFIIAFILAFGVGANDVANSFATSVGSKVLTFHQACILASIFEIAGAVLLGYKVSDTIRKGILEVSIYEGNEEQLMYGMLAALVGCAIWLLIATYIKLPVSTTHSIVGATVGFGLVAHGTKGLNIQTLITIASSWIISPVMSGCISVAIYMIIHKFIIKANRPFNAALISLPFIYAITIFINVLSITLDGSKILKMDNLPLWLVITISTSCAVIIGILAHLLIAPWQKKKILNRNIDEKPSKIESGLGSSVVSVNTIQMGSSANSLAPLPLDKNVESEENVNQLFSFLQVLAAIFSSFAHGGNDVSNAIGPLIAIWLIYKDGAVESSSPTPIWLLLYGGVGMVIGLWVLGKRVIETVGTNLTKITPATGFVIENGAAATVLMASKIGIPISTTHCKVGSVVFVGWVYGHLSSSDKTKKSVDWSLFRSIVYAWVVTLPAAGGMSALCMWIFSFFY
ncbi:CLUMA_CG015333, isoform A [Clunio marinus]|uniref:Phosphate transporter n=1 Tax=Clunio marinus TaxID=568069 RepID=A0A1J1IPG2_9DIPT|nr:CLUMA_CG015333, isoform A [Clunio marinus]